MKQVVDVGEPFLSIFRFCFPTRHHFYFFQVCMYEVMPPLFLSSLMPLTTSYLTIKSFFYKRSLSHWSLLFWIITSTLSIFALFRLVLLILFHSEVPVMILRHLLTNTCSRWMLCCRRFQVSLPYRNVGRITALKSFSLVKTFIFGWFQTSLLMVRKTCDALLIRDSTSASTLLPLLKMLSRYLNLDTSSTFLPSSIDSVGILFEFVLLLLLSFLLELLLLMWLLMILLK